MNKKKIIELALSQKGEIVYVSGDEYPKPVAYAKIDKSKSDYSLCLFGEGLIFVEEASVANLKELPQSIKYAESETIPWPQSKAFITFEYTADGRIVEKSFPVSRKVKLTQDEAVKILGKATLIEVADEKYFVSEVSRQINEAFKHSPEKMPILGFKAAI